MQPPARGADSEQEQETLAPAPVVLGCERGAEVAPERVEEDGVLARLLWKDPFCQPGQEDHLEAAATRVLDGTHEDASVPVGWRALGERDQLAGQDVADLI